MLRPQSGHVQSRPESGIFGILYPQAEHVLLLGYQRFTTMTVFPRWAALYSS